jgi:amino acid transporter
MKKFLKNLLIFALIIGVEFLFVELFIFVSDKLWFSSFSSFTKFYLSVMYSLLFTLVLGLMVLWWVYSLKEHGRKKIKKNWWSLSRVIIGMFGLNIVIFLMLADVPDWIIYLSSSIYVGLIVLFIIRTILKYRKRPKIEAS